MKHMVIAGVPEHFNLPWQATVGRLRATGQAIEWRDVPEGSGAMARGLQAGEYDVAMLLTEAAVAALGPEPAFEIVSTYTESPLIWGIHVPAMSDLREEADIRGRRYAISRQGSGSHLMSFAHAQARGWPLETLEFVEVGTLQGAIDAFATGRAEVFFWEKFMTEPLVESGVFRRVGEFSAPWPAFVVCARREVLELDRRAVERLIAEALGEAQRFAAAPDAAAQITRTYGLRPEQAREWLGLTRWSSEVGVDHAMLRRVADVLVAAGALTERPRLGGFANASRSATDRD